MTDTTFPTAPPASPGGGLFGQFLSFDRLIGTRLVKLTYFIGLVGIGLSAVIGLFGVLAAMTQNFPAGLGALLLMGVGLVIGTLVWRFACELAIMAFLATDRLAEIRDRLPPR